MTFRFAKSSVSDLKKTVLKSQMDAPFVLQRNAVEYSKQKTLGQHFYLILTLFERIDEEEIKI